MRDSRRSGLLVTRLISKIACGIDSLSVRSESWIEKVPSSSRDRVRRRRLRRGGRGVIVSTSIFARTSFASAWDSSSAYIHAFVVAENIGPFVFEADLFCIAG